MAITPATIITRENLRQATPRDVWVFFNALEDVVANMTKMDMDHEFTPDTPELTDWSVGDGLHPYDELRVSLFNELDYILRGEHGLNEDLGPCFIHTARDVYNVPEHVRPRIDGDFYQYDAEHDILRNYHHIIELEPVLSTIYDKAYKMVKRYEESARHGFKDPRYTFTFFLDELDTLFTDVLSEPMLYFIQGLCANHMSYYVKLTRVRLLRRVNLDGVTLN